MFIISIGLASKRHTIGIGVTDGIQSLVEMSIEVIGERIAGILIGLGIVETLTVLFVIFPLFEIDGNKSEFPFPGLLHLLGHLTR